MTDVRRARLLATIGAAALIGAMLPLVSMPAANAAGPIAFTQTEAANTGSQPISIASADLDGDGDLDFATANSQATTVSIVARASNGTYTTTPVDLGTGNPNVKPAAVAAGDLDSDGDVDLATANVLGSNPGNNVTVLRNDGAGTWTPVQYTVAGGPRGIVAADLTGDGKIDLATANGLGSVTVLTQGLGGSLTAASAGTTPANAFPAQITAADLDGDGDMDLATANRGTQNITMFIRGAGGSYTTTSTANAASPNTGALIDLVAGDVDADGDVDLAYSNNPTSNVTVLTRGPGGDYTPTAVPLGSDPVSLTAGDFDRDGDLELVTTNNSGNNYSLLLGGAGGTWTVTNVFYGPHRGYDSVTGDFDKDGDVDFATASLGLSKVGLFSNTKFTSGSPDATAPTTADDVPAGEVTSPVTVTLTATDNVDGSGVDKIRYTVGASPADPRDPGASVYSPASKPVLTNGQKIRYSAIDNAGNSETPKTSVEAQVVATVSTPRMVGNTVVGETIVIDPAVTSTPAGATVTYQWYRNLGGGAREDIAGATDSSYVLQNADVGLTVGVVASASAPGYRTATADSGPTDFVTTTDTTPPTTTDDVPSGDVTSPVVVTLTADDAGGSGVDQIRYTVGATPADPTDPGSSPSVYDSANKPVLTDGQKIRYSAVDLEGNEESPKTSSAANVLATVSTPRMVGNTVVGETIVIDPAVTSTPAGATVTYQWYRNLGGGPREDIAGATDSSYELQNADVGLTVGVIASASAPGYRTATADSGPTDFVAAAPAGPLSFTPQSFDAGAVQPDSVVIADLDNDGTPEIVTSNLGSSNVRVFTRAGDGSYTGSTQGITGSAPFDVVVADLDGDNDLDIATSNSTANTVTVLTRAAGTYTPASYPVSAGSALRSIAAADVDGDGDPELVTTVYNGDTANGSVSVLTRTAGSGGGPDTWTAATVGPTAAGPLALSVTDLDGDGDLDIATADIHTPNVTVLTQDAPGHFVSANHNSGGDSPWTLTTANLDGVGNKEIISANWVTNDLTALTRGSGGAYSAAVLGQTPVHPSGVEAGDLDGDGDLDLAVTSHGSNPSSSAVDGRVSVFQADGGGTFAPRVDYTVGSRTEALDLGDLDGDGDLDIVAVNYNSGTVTVLSNDRLTPPADTLAPTTTDDVPAGEVTSPVEVTLTATDNAGGSGVDEIRYTIGATPADPTDPASGALAYDPANKPDLMDGQKIRYSAVDNAGNEEAPKTSSAAKVTATVSTPRMVGNTVVGETIVIDPAVTATPAFATVSYQWYRNLAGGGREDIAGATGASYVLQNADVGLTVGVIATATAPGYKTANADSGPTDVVAPPPDTTAPVTTDDVPAGDVTSPVTVTLSASDNAGGSGVDKIRYTIGATPADPSVPGNNPTVYDPANKPVLTNGQKIRYYAVDVAGNAETPKTSAAAQVTATVSTPRMVGNTVVGETIVIDPAVTATPAGATVTYQWYRNLAGGPQNIAGATASSYVLQDADAGHTVGVIATASAPGYRSATADSGPTDTVAPAPDTIAPVTTDDVPAGEVTSPVEVTLTATDAGGSGVDEIRYTIGATPADPTTPGSGALAYDPANKPDLMDGQKIRYSAIDNAGNEEAPKTSSAAKVTATVTTPRMVGNTVVGETIVIDPAVTATPAFATVSYQWYRNLAGGGREDIAGATGTSYVLQNADVGLTVGVIATATAPGYKTANADSGPTDVVAPPPDTTAPVTTDDVPAGDVTSPVTVTLSASDNAGGSGVDKIRYTIGATPADPSVPGNNPTVYDPANKPVLTNGQKIRYYAVDVAGNAETPKTSAAAQVTATVSTPRMVGNTVVGETIVIDPAVTATPAGATVTYQWYRNLAGGPQNIAGATASSYVLQDADAGHTVGVIATASAPGYRSATADSGPTDTVAPAPDTIAPVTTDDVPAGEVTSPVEVTLTATDAGGSGVDEIRYTIGATPADPTTPGSGALAYDPANKPDLMDGQKIRYSAIDNAGNEEAPKTSSAAKVTATVTTPRMVGNTVVGETIVIDPAVTATPAFATVSYQWYRNLAGGGREDIAGATGTSYVLQNADVGLTVGVIATASAPGYKTATADSGPTDVVAPPPDTTAPVTTDDVPAGEVTSPVEVTLTATDAGGSGLDEIRYTIGATPADPTTPGSGALAYDPANKPDLMDGQKIRYSAVDNAGNEEAPKTSAAAKVTATVTVPRMVGNTVVGETIVIDPAVTATPAFATVSYQWYRNLAGGGREDIAGATTVTYQLQDADAGRTVGVIATATAPGYKTANADSGPTDTVAPRPDTTAPTTTDNVPSAVVTSPVTVTLTATDNAGGSGVDKIRYLVGAAPADPSVPANTPNVYDPANKPVLTNGQKIRYYAVDLAGNAETPKTSAAAQVDNTAPTTTDNVPTTKVAGPVTVTLTATDGGSGVQQIRYTTGAAPADPSVPGNNPSVYDPANKPVLTNGQKIRYYALDTVGNAETPKSSAVVRVDSNGGPLSFIQSVAGNTGAQPVSIAKADLDGDGDIDFATANSQATTVSILIRGNTGGYASTTVDLGTGNPNIRPVAVTAGDLDGDGDVDLATANGTANNTGNNVTVLKNNGSGAWTTTQYAVAGGPRGIVAADVNGDGKTDLATANGGDSATVLTQVSGGTLTAASAGATPAGALPNGIVATDLDGDGDVDLATSNRGSHNVTVFTRGAGGGYTTSSTTATGGANDAISLVAGDLDADGDVDLATANQGSNSVTVLVRGLAGDYSPTVVNLATSTPLAMAAADFDGDDDLELLVTNNAGNNYSVLRRSPDGTWTVLNTQYGAGHRAYGVVTGDFDGDGDIDFATASLGSSAVGLFTNTRLTPSDTTAPTTTDDVPAGVVTAPVTVTLTATDNAGGTGVQEIRYTVGTTPADPSVPGNIPTVYDPANKPVLTDGQKIRYYALDRIGNAATPKTSAAAQVTATVSTPRMVGNTVVGESIVIDPAVSSTPAGATVTYQWYRNLPGGPENIAGATGSSYVLQPADSGHTVGVLASASAPGYRTATADSGPTDVVTTPDTAAPTTTDDVPAGLVTSPVTVTLTATDTGGSGVDTIRYTTGAAPADPSVPANNPTVYDPASKPVLTDGQKIRYYAVDLAGNAEAPKTSAAAQVTTTVTKPVVSGTVQVGSGLQASTTATPSGAAVVYQWLRDGASIAGANGSTYILQNADVGTAISVVVGAIAPGYRNSVAQSDSTGAVNGGSLAGFTVVAGGGIRVGEDRVAQTSLAGDGSVTLSYQWQQAAGGGKWADLPGGAARKSTYELPPAVMKVNVRVLVTAQRGGSKVEKASAPLLILPGHTDASDPRILGKLKVGKTLRAKIDVRKGIDDLEYIYSWTVAGTSIRLSGRTITVPPGARGKKIFVDIRVSAPGYNNAQLRSPMEEIAP